MDHVPKISFLCMKKKKKKKKKENAGKRLSIKGRAIILEENCNYPDF